MRFRRRPQFTVLLRAAGCAGLALSAGGCFSYRPPQRVEAAIERKAGVELRRESGFKLGRISTALAASLVHHHDEDGDFRDLSGVAVAVFEVTKHTGVPAGRITTKDLGLKGWETMVTVRAHGEQLLVLARPGAGEIRELVVLSIEDDEVVYARCKGHLDRLIEKTLAAVDHEGAHDARAAIGVASD